MDYTALILGALAVGFITGIIDLAYGASKNNMKLGIIGFVACIVLGFLGGAILAVPACILFIWLIQKDAKKRSDFSSAI